MIKWCKSHKHFALWTLYFIFRKFDQQTCKSEHIQNFQTNSIDLKSFSCIESSKYKKAYIYIHSSPGRLKLDLIWCASCGVCECMCACLHERSTHLHFYWNIVGYTNIILYIYFFYFTHRFENNLYCR